MLLRARRERREEANDDDHIDLGVRIYKPFDRIENLYKRIFVYPVITVHYFKIFTGGMLEPAVDGIAVTTVLFFDCFDNSRIFLLIALGDRLCAIAGTIIDYKYLHVFSAPVGYLTRPYVVYRSRDSRPGQPGSTPTRRGWDRVG